MAGHDRRRFIAYGLQASALICVSAAAGPACVDPDDLSDSVQGMRDSLEYTDAAADPKQACRACSYFKPAKASDDCAHCEVLNSPVRASGHCVSWTKRA
ncbi:hypothetical protein [Peristeroidobacter agariperforans]|uniref:hypothetical protein n=1 Tax=Peristeroidobacter agariperforans TaxID=268404 RepID=UPI00101BBD14|nr:hypothetical protein [Peristeroidobacter agariperforans]